VSLELFKGPPCEGAGESNSCVKSATTFLGPGEQDWAHGGCLCRLVHTEVERLFNVSVCVCVCFRLHDKSQIWYWHVSGKKRLHAVEMPYTASVDPNLAKLRRESAEPKCAKSSTERLAPSRPIPAPAPRCLTTYIRSLCFLGDDGFGQLRG
jgi:hypothetical protein